MDVGITGRNRRNRKETFLFYWLDCWPIWGRGEGYLVDIMALGVDAYLLGALIQGNTVSTTSTFLRPFIFPFISQGEKEAFAFTSHHPQRAYYFSSLVFNLFNASRCLYTEFGNWIWAWDSHEQPASLPAKFRHCVACVEWPFWPASEWQSRESARTPAPISSRHHCPRPPCLFLRVRPNPPCYAG